jgi:hypothetical protein
MACQNGHTQSTVFPIEHAISVFLEHGLENKTVIEIPAVKSFLFPNVSMFCGSPSDAMLSLSTRSKPTDFHHIMGPSRNSWVDNDDCITRGFRVIRVLVGI